MDLTSFNLTKKSFRPTWVEISTRAFRNNLLCIKKCLTSPTKILIVVKANAYGHGAPSLSRIAQLCGIHYLGVSSVEEGIILRKNGIKTPILILGSLYPFSSFHAAATYNLVPTVASIESARALSRIGKRKKKKILFHFKVDTGMRRIGVTSLRACEVLKNIVKYPYIALDGIYTHLASADTDRKFTFRQLELLNQVRAHVNRAGIKVPLFHAANSAATILFSESHLDLVRIGLAAYGLRPLRIRRYFTDLQPVLSWKTKVVYLKWIPKNTPVSYGGIYTTKRNTRVATLPVGYADGYNRLLSNGGEVLIQGKRCPIIGRVTMDMIMVDVTDIGKVTIGDKAVLIGSQGKERITAEEIAQKIHTISYEVVCAINSRVPRIFL